MVCIKNDHTKLCGRSLALHFRYLTCLLDKGHITPAVLFLRFRVLFGNQQFLSQVLSPLPPQKFINEGLRTFAITQVGVR